MTSNSKPAPPAQAHAQVGPHHKTEDNVEPPTSKVDSEPIGTGNGEASAGHDETEALEDWLDGVL